MARTVFSEWKSINSQNGINAALLPARYFQVRMNSYFWAYLNGADSGQANSMAQSAGGMSIFVPGMSVKKIEQDFTFEIKRAGTVVFAFAMRMALDLFALSDSWGGGASLAFYTWNFVDSKSFATVTVPDPAPPTLGTSQIDADPTNGFGFTSGVAETNFFVVSPAWELRLEPGDQLFVTHASAGAQYLVKNAAVQIRTIPGESVASTLREPLLGQSWFLYTRNSEVRLASTLRSGGRETATKDSIVLNEPARYGKLHRHRGTLMVFTSGATARLRTAFSDNPDAAEWRDLMNINTDIDIMATALAADGAALYAYGKALVTVEGPKPELPPGVVETPGEEVKGPDILTKNLPAYVVFKNVNGGQWTMAERGNCVIAGTTEPGTLPVTNVVGLEPAGGTLRLTARGSNGVFNVWISGDEGLSWEALASDGGVQDGDEDES